MSAPELPTREDAGFLAGLAARIHAVLMGESARDNLSRSDDERLEAIAMRIATPPAEPPAITDTMRLTEHVAHAIYDAMRAGDPEGQRRPWVPGGNSDKQYEARKLAREAIVAARRGAE